VHFSGKVPQATSTNCIGPAVNESHLSYPDLQDGTSTALVECEPGPLPISRPRVSLSHRASAPRPATLPDPPPIPPASCRQTSRSTRRCVRPPTQGAGACAFDESSKPAFHVPIQGTFHQFAQWRADSQRRALAGRTEDASGWPLASPSVRAVGRCPSCHEQYISKRSLLNKLARVVDSYGRPRACAERHSCFAVVSRFPSKRCG